MRANNWWRKLIKIFLILFILSLFVAGAAYAATNIWPAAGATVVDKLRGVFGEKVVAKVEDIVLKSEDKARQITYGATGSSREINWGGAEPIINGTSGWMPGPVKALADKKNEGQWIPFLSINNQVVAYRTFIAPDPVRPYAFAAVVAFDLQKCKLNFILGTEEPKSSISVVRSGRIPAEDVNVGVLLAAFNGGFKAEHGHFGVMINGQIIIPAVEGLGAVGLYDNGDVRIGILNKDIPETSHLIAWRQNGPLVLQDGQINPLTNNSDPKNWGYVVSSDTATYRSSLGISEDNQTLYYIVGPDLTLPALAQALQAAGVFQAIQLDINNYWAHFDSYKQNANKIQSVPLLDFMKGVDDQRFLGAYIRDYFYVTARK
jgi:hypothetical protein